MKKVNSRVNAAATKNAASKVVLNYKTINSNRRWFSNEIRKERRLYEKEIKSGATDRGFLWASLYLETFIEGVFTQHPVPSQIEVEVPKGMFRLTALEKDGAVKWLIRNDSFGCIAEASPQTLGEWAVENYPDGINSEGYMKVAHSLLTIGCEDESQKQAVWDAMFYDEAEGAA